SAGGSETQQIRMGCIVATTQHFMGELTDQLSGEKKLKDHPHHTPKDLTDAVIEGMLTITKLRREIER
ncbi:MAG: hypothetical protein ABIJ85_03050, partial [bacterium]